MTRSNGISDPELAALLAGRRIARRAAPALRERVLARAWAVVSAGEANAPASRLPHPVAWPAPVRRGWARGLILVVGGVSIAVAATAVGATVALRSGIAPPARVGGR